MKRICIAFLGNALHDSRIVNLTRSLQREGFRTKVIGFDWFISDNEFADDTCRIYKLKKTRFSLFFYLKFAALLKWNLIKEKADLFIAEDFYTLPFVTVIAKLKGARVYYNSRELYAFLGGLRNRPNLQKLVTAIERFFIRKVDLVMTTGEMDSEFLEKFYGIKNTLVIRNIPLLQKPAKRIDFRKIYNIPADGFILIYQGVLLEGRGLPLVFKAMADVEGTYLVIVGDGEEKNNFKKMIEETGIAGRVFFAGVINQSELINYTAGADAGLALIENISISYYHALPNKLFEYIMAGLPVLSSDLPQMRNIVNSYNIGEVIDIEKPGALEETLKRWVKERSLLQKYKEKTYTAALELNWEAEYERARQRLIGDLI